MRKIVGTMRKAINDYQMIKDGDKIAVGISGGKDSMTLLAALANLRRYSKEKFDLVGININMGFSDLNMEEVDKVKAFMDNLDVPFHIENTNIADIIFNIRKEKNPCSLCSKLRRGALNTIAKSQGCNKIALGHHKDDVLETMLLSFIFEGRLSTFMPVSYLSRTDITVIRPFIYVDEADIRGVTQRLNIPIIHNPCPADKHTQRQYMKELVANIKKDIPMAKDRMCSAIMSPDRYNLWNKATDALKTGNFDNFASLENIENMDEEK